MTDRIDFERLMETGHDEREDRVVAAVLERTRERRPPPFDLVAAILDVAPAAAITVLVIAIVTSMLPVRGGARDAAASAGAIVAAPMHAEQLIRQDGTPSMEALVVALEQR